MLPLIRPDLADLAAYHVTALETTDVPDKLDANEVSLDLPDWFKLKLGALAEDQVLSNRYPDGEYTQLKQLLCQYVGHGITTAQITLGNGSDELIRSLLLVTCLHQGAILVAEPTFSMYGILAQTLGIPVVKIRRNETDFALDLAAAQNAMDQQHGGQNIKAVFLVHPNSPTGNLLQEKEKQWLHSLPPEVLVVIDEAYFEFSGKTMIPELADHPNWLVMRTFSKALRLAAYRVGYAVGHPDLIGALEKVRLPYNLPTMSYLAAMLAMMHRDELLTNIPEILSERERVYQGLQDIGLDVWHSAGNFIYARSGNHEQDQALLIALAKRGTIVRQTGGGLRITIGTPEENTRLLERFQYCV